VLQNLSNNVTFGKKEVFLEWLNPFIEENFASTQDYLDQMASLPKDRARSPTVAALKGEGKDAALEKLVSHIKMLRPKFVEYERKSWYAKLMDILLAMDEIKEKYDHSSNRGSYSSQDSYRPKISRDSVGSGSE